MPVYIDSRHESRAVRNFEMLRIFTPTCPVNACQKAWVETRLAWLCQKLGLDRMLQTEVVLPTDAFLENYDGSEPSAREVFRGVCERMQIDASELVLEFQPDESMHGVAGIYEFDASPIAIHVATTQLEDGASMLATFVHELAHHILLGGSLLNVDEQDHEYVTDLLSVYAGFGIFAANSTVRESFERSGNSFGWSVGRQGYLTAREFGYALAVYSHVRGQPDSNWQDYLRLDARSAMAAGKKYIGKTNDCLFQETYDRNGSEISERDLLHDLRSPLPSTRVAALWNVVAQRNDSETVVRAIIECLRHKDADLRSEAASTLGKFGEAAHAATDALIELLRDRDARVRASAATALGTVQRKTSTLPHLAHAIKDQDKPVVFEALVAIGNYGREASHLLRELQPVLREALIDCNHQMADRVVFTASQITDDPEPAIRQFFADDEELQLLALSVFEELQSEEDAATNASPLS